MNDNRSDQCRLLILGAGNPLRRDDGVGVRIAQELEKQGMPQSVHVLDIGTGGLGFIDRMRGIPKVVFLDAVEMGERPGTVRVFTQQEMQKAPEKIQVSLHEIDLPQLLLFASLQGRSPEILVVAIQPKDLGWGTGLSPELERAVPDIVEYVLKNAQTGRASHPSEPSLFRGEKVTL